MNVYLTLTQAAQAAQTPSVSQTIRKMIADTYFCLVPMWYFSGANILRFKCSISRKGFPIYRMGWFMKSHKVGCTVHVIIQLASSGGGNIPCLHQ